MPDGSIARGAGKRPVSGKSRPGTTGSLARPPVMHNMQDADEHSLKAAHVQVDDRTAGSWRDRLK